MYKYRRIRTLAKKRNYNDIAGGSGYELHFPFFKEMDKLVNTLGGV